MQGECPSEQEAVTARIFRNGAFVVRVFADWPCLVFWRALESDSLVEELDHFGCVPTDGWGRVGDD